MRRFLFFIGIILVGLSCSSGVGKQDEPSIYIELWYGEQQEFGKLGLSQKWINILGNVHAKQGIEQFYCLLNDSLRKELTLGSDLHRLAAKGDFNIDFDVSMFREGHNQLEIFVLDSSGVSETKKVDIQVHKENVWALPYEIRWSEVDNIQEVVQVLDGNWEITKEGLHNKDCYYDRVISMGDAAWKEYEVFTSVVFHDFSPPEKGPPTYDVSHAAIATRWPGHDVDGLQPHRKWFPLGATSEFRLTTGLDSCRWRIFDGPKPDSIRFHVEQTPEEYRSIQLHVKYGMKHRVESLGEGRTLYQVKLWPFHEPEPDEWDFEGIEAGENLSRGSALLIAHNTSVTFGDITVTPIKMN